MSPLALRVRRRARAGLPALVLLLWACTAARPMTPGAVAGSQQLVRVDFPEARTVRARAPGGDSLLHRVTAVTGHVRRVYGDTLELRLDRWRAEGHTYPMRTPDVVVTVAPEIGATIRRETEGSFWPVVVGLGVMALVVLAIALSEMSSTGY